VRDIKDALIHYVLTTLLRCGNRTEKGAHACTLIRGREARERASLVIVALA